MLWRGECLKLTFHWNHMWLTMIIWSDPCMFHHAESPSIILRQYKDKGHISHPHERPRSTSRWVHYIGGVWGGFICGPYSIVKSLISTCVWCIKAQGSIGNLTDCRQSKRHASYPYRSVERQRCSSVVAELFAPWIFTKMSPMMTMSHMRWDKGCTVMEAS